MITIKAEVMAGDSVEDAFDTAIRLATTLDVRVEFNANGVTCIARPHGSKAKGVLEYLAALKSDSKIKLAFS